MALGFTGVSGAHDGIHLTFHSVFPLDFLQDMFFMYLGNTNFIIYFLICQNLKG